jgi:hypothetical protein
VDKIVLFELIPDEFSSLINLIILVRPDISSIIPIFIIFQLDIPSGGFFFFTSIAGLILVPAEGPQHDRSLEKILFELRQLFQLIITTNRDGSHSIKNTFPLQICTKLGQLASGPE